MRYWLFQPVTIDHPEFLTVQYGMRWVESSGVFRHVRLSNSLTSWCSSGNWSTTTSITVPIQEVPRRVQMAGRLYWVDSSRQFRPFNPATSTWLPPAAGTFSDVNLCFLTFDGSGESSNPIRAFVWGEVAYSWSGSAWYAVDSGKRFLTATPTGEVASWTADGVRWTQWESMSIPQFDMLEHSFADVVEYD